MKDFFAELELPHSAWLDLEEIKSHHHQRIATAHPDKLGGDVSKATELNEARRILESPAARLKHLVDLLAPSFVPEHKPAPDWELFSSTGEAAREATTLADQLAHTTSPIVRASLLAKSKACEQRISTAKKRVLESMEQLENRTRTLKTTPFDASLTWTLAEEWTYLERLTTTLRQAHASLRSA